jgi:hypothetical protein
MSPNTHCFDGHCLDFYSFDIIENETCGYELGECCALTSDQCKSDDTKEQCIETLEKTGSDECKLALLKMSNFFCGIQVRVIIE